MIKAIEDKLVTILMRRTKSSGGLHLPETASDPQSYCKVISIGEKAKNAGIKEGDIVVAHIRAGMDSVIGKSLLKVLKVDEVYGILEDKEVIEALETPQLQSPSIITR